MSVLKIYGMVSVDNAILNREIIYHHAHIWRKWRCPYINCNRYFNNELILNEHIDFNHQTYPHFETYSGVWRYLKRNLTSIFNRECLDPSYLIPHNPVFKCKKGKCDRIYDFFEPHAHGNKKKDIGEDVLIIDDGYETRIWYDDARSVPKKEFYLNNVHINNILETEETERRMLEAVEDAKKEIEEELMKGEFDNALEKAKRIMRELDYRNRGIYQDKKTEIYDMVKALLNSEETLNNWQRFDDVMKDFMRPDTPSREQIIDDVRFQLVKLIHGCKNGGLEQFRERLQIFIEDHFFSMGKPESESFHTEDMLKRWIMTHYIPDPAICYFPYRKCKWSTEDMKLQDELLLEHFRISHSHETKNVEIETVLLQWGKVNMTKCCIEGMLYSNEDFLRHYILCPNIDCGGYFKEVGYESHMKKLHLKPNSNTLLNQVSLYWKAII
jgi:hypothetical protein